MTVNIADKNMFLIDTEGSDLIFFKATLRIDHYFNFFLTFAPQPS